MTLKLATNLSSLEDGTAGSDRSLVVGFVMHSWINATCSMLVNAVLLKKSLRGGR